MKGNQIIIQNLTQRVKEANIPQHVDARATDGPGLNQAVEKLRSELSHGNNPTGEGYFLDTLKELREDFERLRRATATALGSSPMVPPEAVNEPDLSIGAQVRQNTRMVTEHDLMLKKFVERTENKLHELTTVQEMSGLKHGILEKMLSDLRK